MVGPRSRSVWMKIENRCLINNCNFLWRINTKLHNNRKKMYFRLHPSHFKHYCFQIITVVLAYFHYCFQNWTLTLADLALTCFILSYSNAIWNIYFGFAELTLTVTYFDHGLFFYIIESETYIQVFIQSLSNFVKTTFVCIVPLRTGMWSGLVPFEYTHHLFAFDITLARSKLMDIKPAMILRILRL